MQQLFPLLKSALHVSGDKFAHPQEPILTVYAAFGTMRRHCCRPMPWHRMGEFVARNM